MNGESDWSRDMIPYWLLFLFFASAAMYSGQSRQGTSFSVPSHRVSVPLIMAGLLIAAMVGFRYRVGGDWKNYLLIFQSTESMSLPDALAIGDVGYQFLNWFSASLGAEIWLVNLICALIFAYGLVKFAQTQPHPWLVLVVAVPYLIIVVAMGYTRQAVALGVLMAGLADRLRGGSMLRLAAYVIIAALFHRTAIVAYPLIALASERSRLVNFLVAAATTYFLYDFFLAEEVERFSRNYLDAAYASQGAAIRVAMSVVPALLFLLFQHRLGYSETERRIWRNFSIAVIVLLVLLFVLPSSTAVDRIALYTLPLQLAVLPRIAGTLFSRGLGATLVILYSFAVQFTWLNYAAHAYAWVPYRFYPF